MSNTLRIFSHAISMVFQDPGATFRATKIGASLVAVSVILFLMYAPDFYGVILAASDTPALTPDSAGNFGAAFLGILLMGVGYIMMVAAWHRYVLLPDDQRHEGFTPGAGIVLGYFGRSLLLGLIASLASLPLLFVLGIVASAGNGALLEVLTIPLFAALGWLLLRLSLILPACTIGRNLKIAESWTATRPLSATIFGLTILLGVVDFVLNLLVAGLPAPYILGVVSVVTSVLFALISASILTTLYGIAIEGREI